MKRIQREDTPQRSTWNEPHLKKRRGCRCEDCFNNGPGSDRKAPFLDPLLARLGSQSYVQTSREARLPTRHRSCVVRPLGCGLV